MEVTLKTEKDYTVELLLQQRKELEHNIEEMYKNMFKVIASIIAFVGAIVAAGKWIFDIEISFSWGSPIVGFIIIEFIIILSLTVFAFLVNTNINRDYIIAIDNYLYENYNIKVLFNNGQLSRKHVTGFRGVFPCTTALLGISIIFLFGDIIFQLIRKGWSFYKDNLHLLFFLGIQGIGVIFVLAMNLYRSTNKKDSHITTDASEYFKRKISSKKTD